MDTIWTWVFLLNVYSCLTLTIKEVDIGSSPEFECKPNNAKQMSDFTWATNKTSLASIIVTFANISGSCQQQGTFNTSQYAATCVSTAGPYLFSILYIDKTYEDVAVRCVVSYTDLSSDISDTIVKFRGKQDECSELYKLLALLCLLDVIAFIVLLYRKIEKIERLVYVQVVDIAQNCCGIWIFTKLRLEFVVMLVIKCIQAVIVVPILIVKCECPVNLVVGIAFLLIVGCTVIYMIIFWIVIWCVCRRKIAVNRVDSEITKESPSLRSPVTPGRKLPPLPPSTRTDQTPRVKTDPDKLVNTEKKKKKKKKTKTEINEEDQAETNKSEINDQVDAENLPETNKTSV